MFQSLITVGAVCPLVGLILASLPPTILPSFLHPCLHSQVATPLVCPRCWARCWEYSSELATRPFPALMGLAAGSRMYHTSYGGSWEAQLEWRRWRWGQGSGLLLSERAPLKTPVLYCASLSRHVLVMMSSHNTFWLDGLKLRSLLNQTKLKSFPEIDILRETHPQTKQNPKNESRAVWVLKNVLSRTGSRFRVILPMACKHPIKIRQDCKLGFLLSDTRFFGWLMTNLSFLY